MSEPLEPKKPIINTVVGPPAAPVPPETRSSQDEQSATGPWFKDAQVEMRGLFAPPEAEGELGRLAHFRILKKLGAGGMGMVLLAEDINLLRQVALKIMLPTYAMRPQAKERFLREARAAARIQHDNVVTIHYVGEDRGIPFMAMEFLKGSSLDDYLKVKKSVSLASAMRIAREAAEGLTAAHKKGLIHRDIKPANMWLEAPKGRVKLLDFGLARDAADAEKLTHTGAVLGTPAYMSPEQANGENVDHRTDLFSLGVVLYELVTGCLPFRRPSMLALLHAIKYEPHAPASGSNPQAPAGLVKLIDRLLEKNPTDRPQSAADVVRLLKELEREALRPDGKPMPNEVIVPPKTSVVPDPFAEIDTPVSRDAKSSERSAQNRAGSRERPVVTDDRGLDSHTGRSRDPARRRRLFPAACGVAALLALIVIVFATSSKPSDPEVKKEDPPTVAINPKAEPPKKTIAVEPPKKKDEPKLEPPKKTEDPKQFTKLDPQKKDDPIVEKKVEPAPEPIVKGDETTYDLGNGVKLEMIKINAKGKSFLMGSPKDEADRFANEDQHEVTFNHDWYMGKYEVTQEEYEAIMGTIPSRLKGPFKGPKNPVGIVSWNDAQEFITKLNAKFKDRKITFRLPSEAEWEYACRAGTTTAYNTGKTLTQADAAVFGPASNEGTKPVGTYKPNAFGLYDMHGNVWEWCEDYCGPYKAAPTDGTAQSFKQSDDRRVLRGGSWDCGPRDCRSADRYGGKPDYRGYSVGFRVVVALP